MCQRVRYQRDKHYCDGDNGRNPFQTGQGDPLHATLLFKVKRFVVYREASLCIAITYQWVAFKVPQGVPMRKDRKSFCNIS
jgi:hypothetical protein